MHVCRGTGLPQDSGFLQPREGATPPSWLRWRCVPASEAGRHAESAQVEDKSNVGTPGTRASLQQRPTMNVERWTTQEQLSSGPLLESISNKSGGTTIAEPNWGVAGNPKRVQKISLTSEEDRSSSAVVDLTDGSPLSGGIDIQLSWPEEARSQGQTELQCGAMPNLGGDEVGSEESRQSRRTGTEQQQQQRQRQESKGEQQQQEQQGEQQRSEERR